MSCILVNEAEKSARRAVERIVDPAVASAKSELNSTLDGARNGLLQKAHEAEGSVANDAEDNLRRVQREAEAKLPELAEDAVHEVIAKATADGAKRGLNMALDIVEICALSTVGLVIGIELAFVVQVEFGITVEIPNLVAMLTEIRKWAANPPSGRGQIVACLKNFRPDSIQVDAKVSGNGGFATWSGDDKYDRLDAFMAKQGVG